MTAVTAHGQQSGSIYAQAALTDDQLIPGESALLLVRVINGQPDNRPTTPEVTDVAVNFIRSITQMDDNRNLTQVYAYRVTPVKPGKYIVPPIELSSKGKQLITSPVIFYVHPASSLHSLPSGTNGQDIKIGWFPDKTSLYQGELSSITLKVYSPEALRVVSHGLPDPTKKNL